MKSTFKKVSLLCLSMVGSLLSANVHPQPGQFGIQGEYLYWHPLYERSYFVVDYPATGTANDAQGPRVFNDFNWHSAYRLEGVYAFCNGCNDVRLKWSWLDTNHSKTVTGSDLEPTRFSVANNINNSYSGKASSKLGLQYYAIDLLFGQSIYTCCSGCPFDLWLQAGLQYANINFRETLVYSSPAALADFTATSKYRDCLWGIGPEIALDMSYSLSSLFSCWCNLPLSLTGNLRGALLASKSKSSFYLSNFVPTTGSTTLFFDVPNDKIWRMVPFWDLRLGLAYDWCCSCFTANIEIGYEMLSYHDAIQTTEFSFDGASEDYFRNLSFHGPYLLLGFTF